MMKELKTEFSIQGRKIGLQHKPYFIADVAANHDGDLGRAKELIHMCAEAGADAAKFQHFTADTIVSDRGFKALGGQQSHQASWKKSVYDVYADASLNKDWTQTLKETCDKAGIHFFTSPYSFALVDYVDPFVSAYKVGSGDITWPEIIQSMAKKNKPMLIACGATNADEVYQAVQACREVTGEICLMQCNTNYTASLENFKYIQLNVLNTFKSMFPGMVLGLSDHTPGHATVLGAIALGARVIEKHFTDDNDRTGPDHKFSMNPKSWRDMVDRSYELFVAMGDGVKKVEENEKQTVILQRRAVRFKADLKSGTQLSVENLEVLRPCPADAITPMQMKQVLGKKINKDVIRGDHVRWADLSDV